jgi:GNAT superfamily N-acetyltransferase
MTIDIADYDPSIAPADLARIWFESWTDANPDLAHGRTVEPLIERTAEDLRTGFWQVRVARLGEALVGFAAIVPEEARLAQLFVLPAVQNSGVGGALLRDAMRRHPHGLKLRTQATNIAGLRFYARHGFVETHRVPHETEGYDMVWLRWSA